MVLLLDDAVLAALAASAAQAGPTAGAIGSATAVAAGPPTAATAALAAAPTLAPGSLAAAPGAIGGLGASVAGPPTAATALGNAPVVSNFAVSPGTTAASGGLSGAQKVALAAGATTAGSTQLGPDGGQSVSPSPGPRSSLDQPNVSSQRGQRFSKGAKQGANIGASILSGFGGFPFPVGEGIGPRLGNLAGLGLGIGGNISKGRKPEDEVKGLLMNALLGSALSGGGGGPFKGGLFPGGATPTPSTATAQGPNIGVIGGPSATAAGPPTRAISGLDPKLFEELFRA